MKAEQYGAREQAESSFVAKGCNCVASLAHTRGTALLGAFHQRGFFSHKRPF